MPDISEYCDFDFYDLVWYHTGVHPSISEENRELGHWLGVSHRVGSEMCYWIMTASGKVISETTVQHVTRNDMLDSNIASQIEGFDKTLNERLDDSNFTLPSVGNFAFDKDHYDLPQWDPAYGDNTPDDDEYGPKMHTVPLGDADDLEPDVYDKYIGA